MSGDYSAGAMAGRFARAIGIVAIFAIVGPLTIAALVSLIVVAFGAALLHMFLVLLQLEALRGMISIAIWLLAFVTVVATFPPSVAAGLIFAIAAVYGSVNRIWMAWIAAAIAVAGVVACGMFIAPSESSPLILPDIRSARQALGFMAMLGLLAIGPVSLCWWLAKPLHRARIVA